VRKSWNTFFTDNKGPFVGWYTTSRNHIEFIAANLNSLLAAIMIRIIPTAGIATIDYQLSSY
jgi:hypothetical protein